MKMKAEILKNCLMMIIDDPASRLKKIKAFKTQVQMYCGMQILNDMLTVDKDNTSLMAFS